MTLTEFGFIVSGNGFDPVWTERVIEAIDEAVPVGLVADGP